MGFLRDQDGLGGQRSPRMRPSLDALRGHFPTAALIGPGGWGGQSVCSQSESCPVPSVSRNPRNRHALAALDALNGLKMRLGQQQKLTHPSSGGHERAPDRLSASSLRERKTSLQTPSSLSSRWIWDAEVRGMTAASRPCRLIRGPAFPSVADLLDSSSRS